MDCSLPGSSIHGILQVKVKATQSCLTCWDTPHPHRLYSPWNSPGQNTWVGRFSLQGIFQTHGSNPVLLHCGWTLYQLSHPGKDSEVGCHALLHGIFPTQGWNQDLCVSCTGRKILYYCAAWEAETTPGPLKSQLLMDPKATFSMEYNLIRGLHRTMFTMSCPHSQGKGYAGGAHHSVGILGTNSHLCLPPNY